MSSDRLGYCTFHSRKALLFALVALFFLTLIWMHLNDEVVPVPEYTVDGPLPRQIRPLNDSQWWSHGGLSRALTPTQHEKHVSLLRDLDELLNRSGVEMVMLDGTLLGSYFFHDILPWDDDLDVMVNVEDRFKVFKLFANKTVRKTFGVRGYHGKRDWYSLYSLQHPEEMDPEAALKFKFFRWDSPKAGKYSWRWPYVDIKYYVVENKRVSKYKLGGSSVPSYNVFPLHKRPLGNSWFSAPRNTRAFLHAKYGQFICKSHFWNHRNETQQKAARIPCADILDFYPCVERRWTGKGDGTETLILRGKALYSVQISEPYEAVRGCYDLS